MYLYTELYKILLTLMIIVAIRCTERSVNNKNYKTSIDQINKMAAVYEFRTDSFGSIVDTLSIQMNKFDDFGDKVFSTTKLFKGHYFLRKTEYFKAGTIIYSKSESSDLGVLSIFEFVDEEQKKAISVEYRNNKPYDTIFLEYKDKFENGAKILSNIYGKLGADFQSETIIIYNQKEDPVSELYLLNGDTISLTYYEYDDNNIILSKKFEDYKGNTRTIYKYSNGKLLLEEMFEVENGLVSKINQTEYVLNFSGSLLRKKQSDLISGRISYFRFEYIDK